jgi:hypothetical protein
LNIEGLTSFMSTLSEASHGRRFTPSLWAIIIIAASATMWGGYISITSVRYESFTRYLVQYRSRLAKALSTKPKRSTSMFDELGATNQAFSKKAEFMEASAVY